MTTKITDVTMTKTGAFYDMSLDANGDLAHEDSFDPSLLYSILGERRADPSEVLESRYRGGWQGNQNSDFENGSKVWLFSQSRLTRDRLNGLQSAAFNGLKWLIDDGILKDVTVTVGVVSGVVVLTITLFRFNSKVDTRFFELWNNTGVS